MWDIDKIFANKIELIDEKAIIRVKPMRYIVNNSKYYKGIKESS